MRRILFVLLMKAAKPFLGKGLIDKYVPFVVGLFQTIYARVQKAGIQEVSIPLGARLKVYRQDAGVGLPLVLKGSYEKRQTELFLKSLSAGDVVFDIGANIGYYTVLASRKVGKTGRVFAFEPDWENAQLLFENIRENHCTNVVVEEKAITERGGKIPFSQEKFNKGESSLSYAKNAPPSCAIQGISLDAYRQKQNIKQIDVMKIDIEGAEVGAIKGGRKTFLSNTKMKLFIEYNPSSLSRYSNQPELLVRLVEAMGFRIVSIIDESRRKVLDYSEQSLQEVMSHTTYCNFYCIKE